MRTATGSERAVFRQAALDYHRGDTPEGAVVRVSPPPWTWVTWALTAALTAALVWAWLGGVTGMARVVHPQPTGEAALEENER